MFSQPIPDPTSKPPGLKRSLFNKPSWSKSQPTGAGVDIFRRSDQTYADIVAEEEEKRKRKLARKERERAKQHADGTEREGKRRRISNHREDVHGRISAGSSDEADRSPRAARKSVANPPEKTTARHTPGHTDKEDSPESLLKRYEASVTTAKIAQDRVPQVSNIIDLEEDDKEGFSLAQDLDLEPPQEISQKPTEDDDFPASDEEFPELARKAREKAKLKQMEKEKVSVTPDPVSLNTSNQASAGTESQERQSTPHPPPPDPAVQILITSQIPNTKPLIVSRRLTQRLKDVRVTWCQRQGFTHEATATVFLTWKGKRLFDVTTCKSLGIGVDRDGNVALKGEKDVLGEEDRQIHMEAMTDEILDGYKKAKNGPAPGDPEHNNEEINEPPPPPKGTKIILRSKGYDDFKLIVKSSTLISKIVNAFRNAQKLEPVKEVYLIFDGERLEPGMTVGETDFSDMDYIDVHVK
ncbi:MAG: hypothetical protein M1830_000953 [Pleopsidium flavum]|nr:MAG: hypothetical protein M1830_000953 [Pleopsidium flavum]